ncbi:saccharopine dehydrogenase NADP-binding domain-containing protein [Mycolicibacterium sp. CBMA 226]|uniref:saccharopine dehydrogenase NADP-binding domain-containing protein n=1 Tax=Mycolicibacterium sp. CBMA 226 TaxID=2606611 RepID=UPI0012DFB5FC|nr:saccharopine dehydrogenase NADP-binding domain-containing protein [Mycolicibacterium sp. CBMA 226]MUL78535.1 saccharopine dehydrogenase [Mycolicibacterium sp. CBMA 226]
MQTIWVLGATGKGGRAIASELIGTTTADVVLAGRDHDRLAAAAASIGGRSRTLVAAGPTELATRIAAEKPTVVVNTIGPFGETTGPLARACLTAGSHYVDLANELPPVQELLGLDTEARRAGVALVTGAGFGVLATEALVLELAGGRPAAARATVAAMPTVDGLGSAVLASVVDAVAYGGRRYRNGQLERTRLGADHAWIPVPDLPAIQAIAVPTGELEAARRASGAADVLAFSSEVPSGRTVRAALPALSALLSARPVHTGLQRLISRTKLTPPAKSGDVSWAYARLDWADRTHREAWLRTGEGYSFTAKVAALTAMRLSDGHGSPGAATPGALFGPDLARDAGAQIIVSGSVAP